MSGYFLAGYIVITTAILGEMLITLIEKLIEKRLRKMSKNISCPCRSCDNNTGYGKCMYGVTEELIVKAKNGDPMCENLRMRILKYNNCD